MRSSAGANRRKVDISSGRGAAGRGAAEGGSRPWNPRRTMWSAIGGSVVLLGALLVLGWDDDAWVAAAGVLLVSCLLVCMFALLQSRSTDRQLRRAVVLLAAQRHADEQRRRPKELRHG